MKREKGKEISTRRGAKPEQRASLRYLGTEEKSRKASDLNKVILQLSLVKVTKAASCCLFAQLQPRLTVPVLYTQHPHPHHQMACPNPGPSAVHPVRRHAPRQASNSLSIPASQKKTGRGPSAQTQSTCPESCLLWRLSCCELESWLHSPYS